MLSEARHVLADTGTAAGSPTVLPVVFARWPFCNTDRYMHLRKKHATGAKVLYGMLFDTWLRQYNQCTHFLKQMNPIQMTQNKTAATTDRATIRLTDNTERQ